MTQGNAPARGERRFGRVRPEEVREVRSRVDRMDTRSMLIREAVIGTPIVVTPTNKADRWIFAHQLGRKPKIVDIRPAVNDTTVYKVVDTSSEFIEIYSNVAVGVYKTIDIYLEG